MKKRESATGNDKGQCRGQPEDSEKGGNLLPEVGEERRRWGPVSQLEKGLEQSSWKGPTSQRRHPKKWVGYNTQIDVLRQQRQKRLGRGRTRETCR